jgi:hypothetical protein
METKLKTITWMSTVSVVLLGVYATFEPRLQGFLKYRGYLDLNHSTVTVECAGGNKVLRQEDENRSIRQEACRALLNRIVEEERTVITGFTLWEDNKYIYCEPGRITKSWYDLGIGSNFIQIRKRDGEWRRDGNEWRTSGYVHMQVKELMVIASENGTMSHLRERCGNPYKNVTMPVVLMPGDIFLGTILDDKLVIKNSDQYQLWTMIALTELWTLLWMHKITLCGVNG